MTSAEESILRREIIACAAWLDDWIAEQMLELRLGARGIEHHPPVRKILNEQQTKLTAWRELKLAELQSRLLAVIGRLH